MTARRAAVPAVGAARPRRRVHLVGVGPGDPEQVTLEAVRVLRSVDRVLVVDKSSQRGEADPLAEARLRLLGRHCDPMPAVVAVSDPPRERSPEHTASHEGYAGAVDDWHEARAAAFEEALLDQEGDAAFLVWGDPAFYDSTIRVLDRVRARGRVDLEVDVVPGISSVQVLAARHRIVLHEVGGPVHVTSARRLQEAVAAGQDNVVVMLSSEADVARLADLCTPAGHWRMWWGPNLGTPHEALESGLLWPTLPRVLRARARVRSAAGWVMDLYLLRRTGLTELGS